ncbi:MAG: hypothetical protein K2O34_02305, partial [Acetatifactor sp.]|nr:hypothetical protein [Acetatifactor sp.]
MKRTRLKYYMRALGIGIIVTALLMGYSQRSQAEMTDEEILQRAAELGMTEPQPEVLADIATASPRPTEEPTAEPTVAQPETEATAAPAASSSPQPETEPMATPEAATTTEPTATPAATPTAKPTATPAATPTAKPTATPTAKP